MTVQLRLTLLACLCLPALAHAADGDARPTDLAGSATPTVATSEAGDAKVSITADRRRFRRVETANGTTLRGYIEGADERNVELRLVSGGVLVVPRDSIVAVFDAAEPPSALRVRDPNRTRYLYTPSAMTLRAGEAYFSQKELFFSSLAYGITDNVTILVGAVVPAWLAGPHGFNIIGGLKVGGEIAPSLHVGAGAETFVLPSFGQSVLNMVGFVFGNVTVGDSEAHFTVAAGYPFAFVGNGQSELGSIIVTLNGNIRVSDSFALLSENWIMAGNGNAPFIVDSLAVRHISGRAAYDFGFIALPTENLGSAVPWLDFTYNF